MRKTLWVLPLLVCISAAQADTCETEVVTIGIGPETSGPIPITGGTNSGSLPNLIPNNSDIEDASRQKVTTLHINEPGHCRMQSKNIGTAAAGFFESRCYISDGSKIDNNPRDEGKEDTQGLGIGDTHTEHEDFIAPEYPGIYNAVWCVDSGKNVTESNEGDNCHAEDVFTVWSNPDLIVSSVVLGGGKTSLTPNEVFSINTVITNAGENFGKTILIGYYLSNVLIGTDQIKRENLKGGVSKTETLSGAIAPSTAGSYALKVCADFDNRVQETNENNNCLSVSVSVIGSTPPPNPAPKKTSPAVLKLLYN